MASRDEIRNQMNQDGITHLLTQFVDIHGAPKVKLVPISHFDDVIDTGAGFAGGAVWGLGQGPQSHDMLARIDIDTYTPLPWKDGIARFASDLYVDNKPHPYCSRVNLKRVLSELNQEGYNLYVGVEPEHFLVKRNENGSITPWDSTDTLTKPCYDYKGMSLAMDYLRDVMNGLNELGWDCYQSDHEDANGQFEINFKYAEALVTADRWTFFKMMTSETANRYGAIATFMAKPFTNLTGSAAHLHTHIADPKTGTNLFLDNSDKRGLGLSKLAYHFIAGIMEHAPALCAITSPTVNCFKRLQVGTTSLYGSTSGHTWTPAFISYGDNNRTQMIRTAGPGHLEDRTISAATNPYLTLAAYIKAGLDGIHRELQPGEPNLGNMYDLTMQQIINKGIKIFPQTLNEALDNLENDNVILEGLGPIGDTFLKIKRQEWKDYHKDISQWEIDRYLTLH
jgi:glutamine synthetase